VRLILPDGQPVPFAIIPMYMFSVNPALVSFEPTGTLRCGWQTAWTYGGA